MTATKQSPVTGQHEMFPSAARSLAIKYVPHGAIHPDPKQPRTEADDELEASIRAEGIRQPIQVRPHPEILGEYMILDGERRWRGAAGVMASVPVIVRDDQEVDPVRLIGQLVSNTGKPLTPIEEARAYAKILDGTQMDQGQLAQRLGIPRTTLGDRLRLLELGPWLPLIEKGTVPFSHAVKHLVPLRGVPDEFHAAVIEKCVKDYRWDKGTLSEPDFGSLVTSYYRMYCYPLTKTKDRYEPQPEFPVAAHDRECDCGGVKLRLGHGGARLCCGNRKWWKPLQTKARLAKRPKYKKGAKEEKGAARTPAWAKLPEGGTARSVAHYYHPAKGEMIVIRAGRWMFGEQHSDGQGFDPETFLARVDPTKLVYLPAVKSQYGDGDPARILTTDASAIAAARDVFVKELAIAENQAFAKWLDALNEEEAAISGLGAPALLASLCGAHEARQNVIVAALLCGHALVPRDHGVYGRKDQLVPWIGELSAADAARILTVYTASLAGKKSLRFLHHALIQAELEKRANRPIVWRENEASAKPVKAKKGKTAKPKKAPADDIFDEDDEDDIL